MKGEVSDQQIWSWVDRDAPELEEHLRAHPEDAPRVAGMRATVKRLAASAEESFPEQVGPYRIRGLLGEGGMGRVFDAEQEAPRRRVALKVLRSDLRFDQRHRQLFRREASALARLNHPGIATVYEAGETPQGLPWIAMESIDGVPLPEHLRQQAPSRKERITLLQQVCEAIGHAHDEGVVHRDLKPSNVLVDRSGRPRVVDFGLARLASVEPSLMTRASEQSSLLGTVPYMSPEQVRGQQSLVTVRSDVYSLGVLLYEVLTGHLPYDLGDAPIPEVARRICETPPRHPGRHDRHLRGDLSAILFKALDKDPARRYADATALAADLERVLQGLPVEAQSPGLGLHLRRALRRHWLAVSLTCLLLLVAVTGAFFVAFPARLPFEIGGDWVRLASPFEEVAWVGETPVVQVDGEWYDLVSIDGFRSSFIVGFCQQHSTVWRKRFSEDLVQVLNRMGSWALWNVDLELRDRRTGEIVRREQALDNDRRDEIRNGRYAWPWRVKRLEDQRPVVQLDGDEWFLVSVNGHGVQPADADPVRGQLHAAEFTDLYDHWCDSLGRSPPGTLQVVLESLLDGSVQTLELDRHVPRWIKP